MPRRRRRSTSTGTAANSASWDELRDVLSSHIPKPVEDAALSAALATVIELIFMFKMTKELSLTTETDDEPEDRAEQIVEVREQARREARALGSVPIADQDELHRMNVEHFLALTSPAASRPGRSYRLTTFGHEKGALYDFTRFPEVRE